MNDVRSNQALESKNRERSIVKTSIFGIVGNIVLVAIKLLFGILSASVALISDGINNLTDVLSSVVTIVGTKLAKKKADAKHPFGHGRIEYLTTMVVAVIILASGVLAIVESVKALIELYKNGAISVYSDLSLIMIGVAIVIKLAIGLFYRYRAKIVKSEVLKASGADALWDVALSTSTLVCALVTRFTGVSLEGYFGILIGLFVMRSGISFLKHGSDEIIGHKTEPWLVEAIKDLMKEHQEVQGVYDLMVNEYGEEEGNGSMHIQIRDDMTAKEIHDLTKRIEMEIYKRFNIIMTIGIYANYIKTEETSKIEENINNILSKYENITQTHGLYIDQERKNISFDIVWSFKEKNPEAKTKEIEESLQLIYGDYNIRLVVDRAY